MTKNSCLIAILPYKLFVQKPFLTMTKKKENQGHISRHIKSVNVHHVFTVSLMALLYKESKNHSQSSVLSGFDLPYKRLWLQIKQLYKTSDIPGGTCLNTFRKNRYVICPNVTNMSPYHNHDH